MPLPVVVVSAADSVAFIVKIVFSDVMLVVDVIGFDVVLLFVIEVLVGIVLVVAFVFVLIVDVTIVLAFVVVVLMNTVAVLVLGLLSASDVLTIVLIYDTPENNENHIIYTRTDYFFFRLI